MKKTNKGFSMVELIIVIAIMAILAGALAPALIKYINKSRISTDIQTANTIATAINTGIANESGYDAASDTSGATAFSTIYGGNDAFSKSVTSTVGGTSCPKAKASKCLAGTGTFTPGGDFMYELNKSTNTVKIYATDGTHVLYPTASKCLTDDTLTACSH